MVFYDPSHQNRWPAQQQDDREAGYRYDYLRDRRINAEFYGQDLDHLLPRFVERARGRRLRDLEGPYAGMGPEGYHPNDERILEEVNDRLMQHGWLDARAVRVQVEDGHVTLSGRVDSRRARQMAAETAASVLGVRGVENDLQIRR